MELVVSQGQSDKSLLIGLSAHRIICGVLAIVVALCASIPEAAHAGAATPLPASTKALTDAQAGTLATKVLGPFPSVNGTTVRGVVGHTITIAGISSETAGGTPALQGGCAGAAARFARANRDGGVRGYKINYIGCQDDSSSTQVAHQLVQQDVLQKNVFALVPLTSQATTVQDGTFLNQHHVPFFGAGFTPTYCGWKTAPFAFSSMESVGCLFTGKTQFLSSFAIAIYDAYKKGEKPASIKWAFASTDIPNVRAIANSWASIAKTIGNKVAYNEFPGPGPGAPQVSNWDPVANQIIQSGATVVLDNISGSGALDLVEALRAQGYKGDIQTNGLDSPILLDIPALASQVNGSLAEDAFAGSPGYPSKQMDQVTADLKAIKSTSTVASTATLWGYQAADFFLQALAKTKGKLTTEKLANVINGGFTYAGYGTVAGPSSWPQGHVTQSNFSGIERIDGTNKKTIALIPLGQHGANYVIPASS